MKKLFITSICFLSSLLSFSQEFDGVELRGDIKSTIDKFKQKGYTYQSTDNMLEPETKDKIAYAAMKGIFNNLPVDLIIFYVNLKNNNTKTFEFVVNLPEQKSWQALESMYFTYLSKLEAKYGTDEIKTERFLMAYAINGVGGKLKAVKEGKCDYSAWWVNKRMQYNITKSATIAIKYGEYEGSTAKNEYRQYVKDSLATIENEKKNIEIERKIWDRKSKCNCCFNKIENKTEVGLVNVGIVELFNLVKTRCFIDSMGFLVSKEPIKIRWKTVQGFDDLTNMSGIFDSTVVKLYKAPYDLQGFNFPESEADQISFKVRLNEKEIQGDTTYYIKTFVKVNDGIVVISDEDVVYKRGLTKNEIRENEFRRKQNEEKEKQEKEEMQMQIPLVETILNPSFSSNSLINLKTIISNISTAKVDTIGFLIDVKPELDINSSKKMIINRFEAEYDPKTNRFIKSQNQGMWSDINDLKEGVVYYYRAYAIGKKGIGYGEIGKFSIPKK